MPHQNPISRFFLKATGSVFIATNLLGQERVPFLPLEQIQALRDKRLRQIVRYAAKTVPYYRDLFRIEKINPEDIRTATDLRILPLLDKRLVREHPERFVSTAMKGRITLPLKTSGSTGTPSTIIHDRNSVLANTAFSERETAVNKEFLGAGTSGRTLTVSYPQSTNYLVRAFVRENAIIPSRYNVDSTSFFDSIEENIGAFNRVKPTLIAGQGSFIELLFRIIEERGIQIHRPRLIVYSASPITEVGMRRIEENFGIPVISRYNSVECFKIGFTCAERRGFHLHDDLTHIRIVNRGGQDVDADEEGEVVISNLVNRGTVLLNYRLGDVAAFSNEACPCGRNFRMISTLVGRVEDFIQRADGSYIHPRAIWMIFKQRNDVLQYQLVQRTLTNFELALTVNDPALFEQIANDSVARLYQVLGDDVNITITRREMVETYGARKFRPVISFVTNADAIKDRD